MDVEKEIASIRQQIETEKALRALSKKWFITVGAAVVAMAGYATVFQIPKEATQAAQEAARKVAEQKAKEEVAKQLEELGATETLERIQAYEEESRTAADAAREAKESTEKILQETRLVARPGFQDVSAVQAKHKNGFEVEAWRLDLDPQLTYVAEVVFLNEPAAGSRQEERRAVLNPVDRDDGTERILDASTYYPDRERTIRFTGRDEAFVFAYSKDEGGWRSQERQWSDVSLGQDQAFFCFGLDSLGGATVVKVSAVRGEQ